MKRIFVAADGRVRSGWVLLVFALVAGGVIGGLDFAAMILVGYDLRDIDDPRAAFFTWPTLLGALAATLVCRFAFKEEVGLRLEHAARRVAWGAVAGLGLVALASVVPALVGATTLRWSGNSASRLLFVSLIHAFALAPTGIAEELLLRGVPLKALSRGTHPVVAVTLTGLVFGALHLMNPNASAVAALNVALVGAWFGAVAVRTGSLWMPFGLHVAWNYAEGVVFGQPVSGIAPGVAFFRASWPHDAGFWSGGDFGPEAAGWTAVLLAVAIVVTLVWRRPSGPETVAPF